MARDGGFCDCCGKHHICSSPDMIDALKYALIKDKPKERNLLTIELQDESSVPKVFYKGEEITGKVNIAFDWDISDAYSPGGLTYVIEHGETGNGQATINVIERRLRDHAT